MKGEGRNLLFCLCFQFVTRLQSCPLYVYPYIALCVSHGLQGVVHLFTTSHVKFSLNQEFFLLVQTEYSTGVDPGFFLHH